MYASPPAGSTRPTRSAKGRPPGLNYGRVFARDLEAWRALLHRRQSVERPRHRCVADRSCFLIAQLVWMMKLSPPAV